MFIMCLQYIWQCFGKLFREKDYKNLTKKEKIYNKLIQTLANKENYINKRHNIHSNKQILLKKAFLTHILK